MFYNFNYTHFINLWKQNMDHNLLGKASKDYVLMLKINLFSPAA